ncbi:MAG: hypothetical protein FWE91_11850 [Defluviitaleaceae bacterium]|nr:hypothetical protein [Defluviitaleaceae bacterium]MCL2836733.1 hypothetical protein [Defluviitaleaceae bacterium]
MEMEKVKKRTLLFILVVITLIGLSFSVCGIVWYWHMRSSYNPLLANERIVSIEHTPNPSSRGAVNQRRYFYTDEEDKYTVYIALPNFLDFGGGDICIRLDTAEVLETGEWTYIRDFSVDLFVNPGDRTLKELREKGSWRRRLTIRELDNPEAFDYALEMHVDVDRYGNFLAAGRYGRGGYTLLDPDIPEDKALIEGWLDLYERAHDDVSKVLRIADEFFGEGVLR